MNNMYLWRYDDVIGKSVNSLIIDIPSPKNFSYYWNFGISLGVFLIIQIVSGLLLAMCYISEINISFACVDLIVRDIDYGWCVRNFHSNGASFFFLCIYLHMSRGLYYYSFYFVKLWITGVIILILSMAAGFFGYVLPWGQMSYWAATVITNLFSVIPFVGLTVVQWLWGGFAVSLPTLNRFFALHFLCPFIILLVSVIHIIFLHEKGSSNPLGVVSDSDKIVFAPYYVDKDLYFVLLILMVYCVVSFYFPYKIINTANFLESNPLVTPEHIEPEWYLLAPYTILRSVPNKVGGVVMLIMFFVVLIGLPFYVWNTVRGFSYNLFYQLLFYSWIVNYIFLTWCGSVPAEFPYIVLSQISCGFFFVFFVIVGLLGLNE
uniref:Cytochrome b n=1 Tax=Vorticeros sp. n. MW-2019 TaxID=2544881 RepID=A0AA50AHX9_9PLAT|nr:cytochrome b [Vorticeros sp. n. MW-2019]